ncbi:uncharacterized protein J8A68_001341 [[Candida] subhashii]|uniref:GPI-anchored protein 46 n=1 Tax=[Candida] subhashii TaxID=561895 RepID=A0A8J5V062_9ASCO|nr:uncharacterized protein J8A68_001341 [[Candida] subhashii]KAG7665285.1 hypothetical protein J8A68_001341 [[Candida] subhashii]
MNLSFLSLHLFVLLFLSAIPSNSFDLVLNDKEIENPIQYVKSSFKHYVPTPELQETLEIPVNAHQQSIRESFIPARPAKDKKRVRLMKHFRNEIKPMSIKQGEKGTPEEKEDERFDKSDHSEEETDNEESSTDSSLPPTSSDSPKVHSKKSWIKEFLLFQQSHQKVNALNIEEKAEHPKLRTTIKSYEDTASDPNDLKRWIQLIAQDEPQVTNNGITKKYSNRNANINNNNNEIEIDIEEFIKYLVNEQGFNPKDLQFLKMKNLDYGLGEIEQELNKLKDAKRSPKVIKIGGEEENKAWSIPIPCSYFAIFIIIVVFG